MTDYVMPPEYVFDFDPSDDIETGMTLEVGEETLTFTHGQGIAEGYGRARNFFVVFALHDPDEIGVGEYPYRVFAKLADGTMILDEEGVLEIIESPTGETKSPGGPLWFDALHPSSPPKPEEGIVLPDPEVPASVQSERLRICQECPFFSSVDAQCSECGCFMPFKTGLKAAECPVGKWKSWSI